GREREARRRRQAMTGLPFPIHSRAHVEDGFVGHRLVELLHPEHHDEVAQPGRDERVRIADPHRPRRAHVLGPGRERRRPDTQRLGRHRADVALERGSLRHHGADDEALQLFRPERRNRVEARLAGLPDQIAIARLPHAALRHARAPQRHLPHRVSSGLSMTRSRSRAINSRRISLVPPPNRRKRESRRYRWIGYSVARLYEAKMRAASSVTRAAISDAASLAMAASRVTRSPRSSAAAVSEVIRVAPWIPGRMSASV